MYAKHMICIYSLKILYTSGFNKIAKNQILIKYTEFKYGIYKNVYKPYINCIISVYIFLIGKSWVIMMRIFWVMMIMK